MSVNNQDKKIVSQSAIVLSIALLSTCALVYAAGSSSQDGADVSIWTSQEKKLLLSLSAHHLPVIAEDLSNQYQNNPQAVALGAKLFFDSRLSESGTIACSVCHQPNREFSDGLSVASGLEKGQRNTPSLLGVSHQKWFFWDGRKDSLWAQALEPFEDKAEHNLSRTKLLKIVLADPDYLKLYQAIFTEFPSTKDVLSWPDHASPVRDLDALKVWKGLPKKTRQSVNRAFSNLGKSIAAYEATLAYKVSKFDQYLLDLKNDTTSTRFNASEVAGLKLFIGKGQCVNCHSSPLLSNQHFQNIGSATRGNDKGRSSVAESQAWDSFNCLGEFSDAPKSYCSDLKYMSKDRHALSGSFKVPSLRNVSKTAPYLHDGRFKTLEQVVDFYLDPPSKQRSRNHLPTIVLNKDEKSQLIEFLKTL